MTTTARSAEMARRWIGSWSKMDLDWLRRSLAPGFVHVSPFGRLEGRDAYLATVEPMARKSVAALTVREVIAEGDRAAIWFENRTPGGSVESCDWLRIEDDQIAEVRSFYDPAKVKQVLSPSDQKELGGDGGEPPGRG